MQITPNEFELLEAIANTDFASGVSAGRESMLAEQCTCANFDEDMMKPLNWNRFKTASVLGSLMEKDLAFLHSPFWDNEQGKDQYMLTEAGINTFFDNRT